MVYDLRRTPDFEAWLTGLHDGRALSAVTARLRRLETLGHWGDAKGVGGGVTELRIFYGPGLRVYVTEREGKLVIILGGGDKDSQARDIEKAKSLAKEIE